MPTRERTRRKAAKRRATLRPATKPKRRMVRFEAEPWYAEAARQLSASKKSADQRPATSLSADA